MFFDWFFVCVKEGAIIYTTSVMDMKNRWNSHTDVKHMHSYYCIPRQKI